MISNSLGIDSIHGDIHDRSCNKRKFLLILFIYMYSVGCTDSVNIIYILNGMAIG